MQLIQHSKACANIRVELEREDLKDRERVALAFRLGQLVYQRSDLEQSHENARYQARNL